MLCRNVMWLYNVLHDVIFQKIEIFITIALITSKPILLKNVTFQRKYFECFALKWIELCRMTLLN
jgi:hypothetical protein